MYDIIVIGAGPAGITAGIYAARKKLKTLVLAKAVGGEMVLSPDVENYTGFSLISGTELAENFRKHLESVKEDLELREGAEVISLERNVTSFTVQEKTGYIHYGKVVIICSGREPKPLGIPGEQQLRGKGVSVCAICDAPLYKDKDVAVIGGGNSAMDALLTLSKVARRIYSINENTELSGDEVLKSKVTSQPNITFLASCQPKELIGDEIVSGVRVLRTGGKEEIIPVSGVFVEIGWEPNVAFDRMSKKSQSGEIMVDKNLQTSVPGLFAAGDCNDAWGEQIIIAAGEGAKAALAAADFLAKNK